MKIIYFPFLLVVLATFSLNPPLSDAKDRLSFRLVESEYKISDILQTGVDIDKSKYESFSRDDKIYVVYRRVDLSDKNFKCDEMLGKSNYHAGSSGGSAKNQVSFIFNEKARKKLKELSENNIGRKLAVVFDGKLLMTATVMEPISEGKITASGLKYEVARGLWDAIETVCARESNLSFRLIHPDQEKMFQTPQLEEGVDKSQYERLTKDDVNYWVSKNVRLDKEDFGQAAIFVRAKLPNSDYSEEVELKDIPFNDGDEVARHIPGMRVKIDLTKEGISKLEKFTGNNIGRKFAVVFEGRLLMISTILEKEVNREVITIGDLSYVEAKRLTDVINNKPAVH